MYLVEPYFKLIQPELNFDQVFQLLNKIIDQWRYNGQIIGREIPLYFTQQNGFAMRLICPEQNSLEAKFNNQQVENALRELENCGVILESFMIIADDFNSDCTSQHFKPSWQMLYTTHLQSASPLHSGEDFSPIPLYRQLQHQPALSRDLIKWQENWQSCDQLQMNGSVLEQQALTEISDFNSSLTKHGIALSKEIEQLSQIPTYYYLYRVGGDDLATEQQRLCPSCGGNWALSQPLFDLFHFKCDQCRLISNLSWNFL